MRYDTTYQSALANAAHLIALDDTVVYLRDEEGFDWSKVTAIDASNSYRLSGPSSMYVIAEEAGLTFKLNVEFEGRDADGRGVSLFERDRLREVAMKMPPAARKAFADMLARDVLPGMAKRSAEIREALNTQLDSEDCVRGLIAFATESVA